MEIRVPCTHCGKVLLVRDELAARVGICPNCHNKVVIARSGPNDTPTRSADTPPTSGVLRKTKVSPAKSAPPVESSNSLGDKGTKSTARSEPFAGSNRASRDSSAKVGEAVSAPTTPNQIPTGSSNLDPLAEIPDAVWFVRSPGGGQFGPASNQVMQTWINEGRVGTQSLVWRAGWGDWLPADRVFDSMLDSPRSVGSPNAAATSKAAAYLEKRQQRRAVVPTVWILISLALIAVTAFLIIIF